jgi:hypothetical protein
MLAFPFPLLTLATAAVAADPTPPKLTYLYSANVTFGDTVSIGSVPTGTRNLLPISGGTFSGPKLSGNYTTTPPPPNQQHNPN